MAVLNRIQRRCRRDAADIAAMLAELEAAVAEAGCPPARSAALLVVAEEMATNVAHHAWPAGVLPAIFIVTAGISRRGGGIEVLLSTEDDGIPFDPTLREPPDTDAPVELRGIGGLGIHLVMRMTAWQCYRREGGRNRFSVIWRCDARRG
ncbi:ATP-binding protein [Roseomonas sp. CAU 1739]|uniref:ATP-binding protein n=1 Tax=Roseomonas sp. CAU 1739 TaxID=3140364 RepID=UPI00325B81E2